MLFQPTNRGGGPHMIEFFIGRPSLATRPPINPPANCWDAGRRCVSALMQFYSGAQELRIVLQGNSEALLSISAPQEAGQRGCWDVERGLCAEVVLVVVQVSMKRKYSS